MATLTKTRRRPQHCELFENLIVGGILTMGHATGHIPVELCDGWRVRTKVGDAEITVGADEEGYWVCCTFKEVKRARKEVACDSEGQWSFHMHGEPWTAAAAILDAIMYVRVV